MADFTPPPPFEEDVHVSPYEIFRRLANGERPTFVDLRPGGRTLIGAARAPAAATFESGTILIDEDGSEATETARRLRDQGLDVKALYGGIQLWDFALDPLVVGEERFLTEV